MTDDTQPTQPYLWLTNLYCPFDNTDKAWLENLADYKVGRPQVAKDRPTALTYDELTDFNLVGIYTTEAAVRKKNPEKITQSIARNMLTAPFEPLTSHLAKYLDENCHFVGAQ